jgi:hypothetical protein
MHCAKKKILVYCSAVFASKSGRDRRRDITRAAAGKDIVLLGMQPGEPVVNWGEAPDHVHSGSPGRAGPGVQVTGPRPPCLVRGAAAGGAPQGVRQNWSPRDRQTGCATAFFATSVIRRQMWK